MKPILFNTEMVRAILDGRKTVTRRVVLEKTLEKFDEYEDFCNAVSPMDIPCSREYEEEFFTRRTPYRPGDLLYVRETWAQNANGGWFYKADGKNEVFNWCSSIHMPREAARIFLRVTNVRVERLQDINDDEALKEGFGYFGAVDWIKSPFYDFRDSWDSTLKPKDRALYGWAANPWVWVIEFERVSRKEEAGGFTIFTDDSGFCSEKIEAIGNIYDNPEILGRSI